MITEDFVSLEIAKLLKEKGFNEPCECFYDTEHNNIPLVNGWMNMSNSQLEEREFLCYSAPTLQMAMKWLRKEHNIHIAVIVSYHHIPRRYEAHIMKLENIDDFILHPQVDFASYEEACEAAIKYCLENLI